MTEKRFYVFDRQVGTLTRWSSINCRYWVVDRTTNLPVDEYTTKRPASMAASHYNNYGL